MAEIIIKREIALKYKLDIYAPKGNYFIEFPDGHHEYETSDENTKLWDSLDESTQESCIKSCVEDNKDLGNILEEMN